MTNFAKRSTRVRRSILDGVLPGQETIQTRLALGDGTERVIFNLQNVYYLPNSLSNLISLSFFNDTSIYYDNKQ